MNFCRSSSLTPRSANSCRVSRIAASISASVSPEAGILHHDEGHLAGQFAAGMTDEGADRAPALHQALVQQGGFALAENLGRRIQRRFVRMAVVAPSETASRSRAGGCCPPASRSGPPPAGRAAAAGPRRPGRPGSGRSTSRPIPASAPVDVAADGQGARCSGRTSAGRSAAGRPAGRIQVLGQPITGQE
jgi:hypothetical protein